MSYRAAVTRLGPRVKTVAAIAAVLAAIFILGWRNAPGLLTSHHAVLIQAIVTGILIGGVYSLISIGLTVIFGVLKVINFAHGSLVAIGLYLTFTFVTNAGLDPYVSLPIVIAILFVIGAGTQKFLIQPTSGHAVENQLLVTVALSTLIGSALLLVFSPTPHSISVGYANANLSIFGAVTTVSRVIAFGGALIASLSLWLFLERSRFGTAIRAVAQSPTGASLVGINVKRIYMFAFALGAACTGVAGTLALPFLSITPTSGQSFTLIAFVTVVLGGIASLPGALVGGLVIGMTYELSGLLLPGQDKLLLVFVVFVAVLLFKPQGIFGGGAGR
jgi:branched-chain amino acid transport system permease protein